MSDVAGSIYLTEEQILPAQSAKKLHSHSNNECTVIMNWTHIVMHIVIL